MVTTALIALALTASPPAASKAKRTDPPKPAPAAAQAPAPAPAKPAVFRWDVPGVVSEIEVPALMETNGIPNRFHVVLSSLKAQALYDHFFDAFVKAGLHVPPPEQQLKLEGQVMLTGFDPQSETSYSVILQPYPNGNTSVIMGEAYFAGRTIAPSSDSFAPLFPGAEHVITSNVEAAQTLSYSVRAKPEEVMAFYQETLPTVGFARGKGGLFTRGEEVIQVMAKTVAGQPWTEVALMRSLQPADPAALTPR